MGKKRKAKSTPPKKRITNNRYEKPGATSAKRKKKGKSY